MTDRAENHSRDAFAEAVADQIRQSRRRQGLTQAQVAARTGGLVSKAALANYESRHRSLRIDVFWTIAKALGEDAGTILSRAEKGSGYGTAADSGPITIDVRDVEAAADPRLAPVKRWFALRLHHGRGGGPASYSVTLDVTAVDALASLMDVGSNECRGILEQVGERRRTA